MNLTIKNEFIPIALLGLLLLILIAVGVQGLPSPLAILRLLLGLSFVLFVPGYLMQGAVFPRASDLDGPERVALSFGLSVAVISLIALALDRLPWGIFQWPIVAAEALLITLCGAAVWYRRRRIPGDERVAPQLAFDPGAWWSAQDRANRFLLGLLGLALTVALVASAAIFLLPKPGQHFTEFYITGVTGLAEDYPREAPPGETLSVNLGIANKERQQQSYRVQLWAADPLTDRRELIQEAGPFVLDVGESLEQPVEWRMPWAGDDQQVEFYLFSGDEETTEPYRRLRLWLNVVDEQS